MTNYTIITIIEPPCHITERGIQILGPIGDYDNFDSQPLSK